MASKEPEIVRLVQGPYQTNCYLVICPETRVALVIDPAVHSEAVVQAARQKTARIEQILLTHMHPDHIAGVAGLKEATGARVLAHPLDAELITSRPEAFKSAMQMFGLQPSMLPELLPDVLIEGGETLCIGQLSGTIIHTPGHTPGCVCLRVGHHLFSGDTLFAQGVGRVDLPGGNLEMLLQSLQSLFTLPAETAVYPGHGPSTTIGAERQDNPYVR